ncbi:hypothetical protein [Nonomuraea longicatena]
MLTESWTEAKKVFARLFSGNGSLLTELDASRGELVAAHEQGDSAVAADIEAEWRLRLRRLSTSDPETAAGFVHLLTSLDSPPTTRAADVHNSIIGGVHLGPVVQAGHISRLTFRAPPDRM